MKSAASSTAFAVSPVAVRRHAAGLALVAIAATSHAQVQRVRGVLTDSATRDRVPSAVVILYDSAGRGLARAISDADGAFSIFRAPATRTMRIMRIGFRPREVSLGGADSVVNAMLQPIPSLLGSVQAAARPVCGDSRDRNPVLDLWEQARAGLLASLVSREASPPRIRLRNYRRAIEPVLRRTVADTVDYRDVVDARSFVAARPPWVFAEYGYMRETREGRVFYAPDEGVLLDPTFAETHCLRAIEGRGPRASQIGIAFDPIETADRDTIVDVAGALWLDRTTYAPHDIEFSYTNLERPGADAGGEVSFSVMPNGIWMVDRWEIRAVVVAVDQPVSNTGLVRRQQRRRDQTDIRILGYQHMGGQIASALWPDGKRYQGDLPTVWGRVVAADSSPVANAVVWIFDRRDTVRTDSNGAFRFPPMEPGLYTIVASDSALASAGVYRSLPITTVVLASEGASVTLPLYSRAEVLPSVCPSKSYRVGTGVLFARVVDSAGVGIPTAQVEIQSLALNDTTAAGKGGATRMGVTGDDGRFVVCGAERNRRMIVRAYKGDRGAGVSIDRWGDEVLSLSLTVKPLKP